jgi:hypothetical protein
MAEYLQLQQTKSSFDARAFADLSLLLHMTSYRLCASVVNLLLSCVPRNF